MTFLYFTHLQNIIDKGKQIIRCYLHLFMIFLYQFLILKIESRQSLTDNNTIQEVS